MSDDISFNQENTDTKILIVEDDDYFRKMLTARTQSALGEVHCVEVDSLLDAKRIIKSQQFDLAILDLNLPDGLGPKTIQEVKEIQKNLKIVGVTSLYTTITAEECQKMGALCLIDKSKLADNILENTLQKIM